MSRTVAWHPRAESDLHRMHWRAAALVDDAVQRFAERGEGTLRAVTTDGQRELRLYVLRTLRGSR